MGPVPQGPLHLRIVSRDGELSSDRGYSHQLTTPAGLQSGTQSQSSLRGSDGPRLGSANARVRGSSTRPDASAPGRTGSVQVLPKPHESEFEQLSQLRGPSVDRPPDSFPVGQGSPTYSIHFLRFHPDYKMMNLPHTPVRTLEEHCKVAREEGLRYVYVGNVPGHPWSTPIVPSATP